MRVRFVRFGASSLDVEAFAHVTAPDWASYLTIQEELLIAFMEIVAESGTSLAFPSRTVYLGKDATPGATPPAPPGG
jgi:MscS family membrane protein